MTGMANAATQTQMQQSDMNQADTINTEMQADQQKQQARKWQIMQDTQNKIFEIQQDVTVNKAKTGDKMFGKWDEYIRS
ncbi:MAG: hypothetical protein LWY06_00520 [Firmicutes bacterium]|nr:hypothetical protein [Bacillota bacterium]